LLVSNPKIILNQQDIEDFEGQLEGYHDYFADCFNRIELQGHFYRYMAGQFCELKRKLKEPIVFAVEGGKVRAMQRFCCRCHLGRRKNPA